MRDLLNRVRVIVVGNNRIRLIENMNANRLLRHRLAATAGPLPHSTHLSTGPSSIGLLGSAQLIDVIEQLFEAAAHLLAFRLQRLNLVGKTRILVAGFRERGLRLVQLVRQGVFLLTKLKNQRYGSLDAILKSRKRVRFLLFGNLNRCGRHVGIFYFALAIAALAWAASSANCALSSAAVAASTLRSSSMPATLRPCMN